MGDVERTRRIHALKEVDINRLAAAVIIPRVSEVYLGLLQNCIPYRLVEGRVTLAGIDANSTSIEAFVDIDCGRITVIDNGQGMTPDTLNKILNSSGFVL